MYKVSQKFAIGKKYSVSVEGDVTLLKTGLKLKDENGNNFERRYKKVREEFRNSRILAYI